MLVFSICMIKKLKEHAKNTQHLKNNNVQHHHETNHVTMCIISMNIQFVVLNTPFFITSLCKSIYRIDKNNDKSLIAYAIINNLNKLAFDLTNFYYIFMF